jgi:hypothetical protein
MFNHDGINSIPAPLCSCLHVKLSFLISDLLNLLNIKFSPYIRKSIKILISWASFECEPRCSMWKRDTSLQILYVAEQIGMPQCADSGEVPHVNNFTWHTWHQSCSTKPSLTPLYQPSVLYNPSLTLPL